MIEGKRQDLPKEQVEIRKLGPDEKIYDLYYWDEVIQEVGCGGKVVVCSPKDTPGSPVTAGGTCFSGGGSESTWSGSHVMKIKSKEDLISHGSEAKFRKAHMKMLNLPPHTGVLPLHEVLEDDTFYYVVMEKATGGTLLCSLLEEFSDGIMPERAVKRLMQEILSAIGHLHESGILHRDIKPDNLVVQIYDEPCSPGGKVRRVKLIDFDIADPDWTPMSPSKRSNWSGTLQNSAPETFIGTFSQRSDLYSVGILLYLLMTGRQPFDDTIYEAHYDYQNLEQVYDKLLHATIDWTGDCWDSQSLCRDFCQWLLAFDPDSRPACAADAASHAWFRSSKATSST
jgi:serine/threonine protein kinase